MPELIVGVPAPVTYIPPTGDTTLNTSGAANKGILFTQANLPPELQKLKSLIIELVKPSSNTASAEDEKSGNVGGPSDEDLNMLLGEIDELIANLKYKTGKTKLGMDEEQKKKLAKLSADALSKANEKMKEAQEAAGKSTTAGWIMAGLAMGGAILLCVVTIAAAAATGGTVGALGVTACIGAVMLATQMITDMSLKEAGTQYTACTGQTKQLDVSMGGMVDAIVDREIVNKDIIVVRQNADGQFLDKDGNVTNVDPREGKKSTALCFTPEELSDWKMGWTITTTLVVAMALGGLGNLGSKGGDLASGGIRAADAAAKGGNAAKSASSAARWSAVERGAEILAAGSGLAAGVTAVTKGVIDLFIAELSRDSEEARADKAFYDVQSQDAAHAWDMTMDFLRDIVQQYLENGQARAKNVADRGRTAAALTRPIMT